MAYEWLVTADWHNIDVFSAYAGTTVERTNLQARTGTYSFRITGVSNSWLQMSVASSATKYLGAGFYAATAQDNGHSFAFREGTTNHVTVVFNSQAGQIEARRGTRTGTLLGSGGSIATGKWYFVGIKVVVHDTAGSVQVLLDGVEIINLTDVDTRNGATGVIDNIRLDNYTGNGNYLYLDDIKVRDDAIPGVGGVTVYLPAAAGDDAGWTASAGDPWQCVDEVPASYTDYISADVETLNTKATFVHGGLAESSYRSIDCVCVAAAGKLSASGSGSVRTIIKSGSSYANGPSRAMSTDTRYAHLFQMTNPDGGGAWTKSAVNAAQPGVETI